jgi:hypothetical protein
MNQIDRACVGRGAHVSARRALLASCPPRERPGPDPDGEAIRLAERKRLAVTIDRDLREACRAQAAARLAAGATARELLRRRAYRRLGFVRLSDYARERLGLSARALESAAWVAEQLAALSAIGAAFARGELTWTQVRLLCRIARCDDEAAWLAHARGATVEALEGLIESARARGGPAPAADPEDDPDLMEGEPRVHLRIACPARLRPLWRAAVELARRVAGEQLPPWRAAEVIAAEGIAGRPAGSAVGDRVLVVWIRLVRRLRRRAAHGAKDATSVRAEPEGTTAREARHSAAVHEPAPPDARRSSVACTAGPSDGASPLPDDGVALSDRALRWPNDAAGPADRHRLADGAPGLSSGPAVLDAGTTTLAGCDAFALDARLQDAMRALRGAEPRIGRLMSILVDHRLYRALGFPSVNGYVRNRLGLSLRKAWALMKIEKTVRRAPAFAEAYVSGQLSWVRALTLLPVVDREIASDWIARARRHGAATRRRGDLGARYPRRGWPERITRAAPGGYRPCLAGAEARRRGGPAMWRPPRAGGRPRRYGAQGSPLPQNGIRNRRANRCGVDPTGSGAA